MLDSHQHFWHYDPIRDSWITEKMAILQKDFLPETLENIYTAQGIKGCIAVQADQSLAETNFLLSLAEKHEFIKGVIGWLDLTDPELNEKLQHYSHFNKFKGLRHIAQGQQSGFLLRPEFLAGIAQLHDYSLTYDILIFHDQLAEANEFVEHFPNQSFVLDHMAKPPIGKSMTSWKSNIQRIAQHKNLYCKLSGLVTEADWQVWQAKDFYPYLDVALEAFGEDRVMFGSDWPVCLLAANYSDVLALIKDYTVQFSEQTKHKLFYQNCADFYNVA